MDKEPEELQYLGFFGVCAESFKLLRSWRQIFSQIAISLITPLSLLFFTHIAISASLFSKINRNEDALDDTPANSAAERQILHRLADEWIGYFIFKAFYLLFLLVFALLSTSAVVYSVAAVYTAKDLTFRKILAVVPKVWRRLMITFLYAFLLLFAYNFASAILIVFIVLLLGPGTAGAVGLTISVVFYLAGLIYISVIWHLASVISVLEDDCGIAAMRKSRTLIRGKLGLSIVIFLMLNFYFLLVEVGFRLLVVDGWRLGIGAGERFLYAFLLLVLLTAVILFALVIQTVIYFVCKSHHHESIDKSSLSDHLEVYLGEYVPLKEKDVQLEQLDL